MIGLGVGIDYALFVVTRHREGLHTGRSPRAPPSSRWTAGRAVTFAGATVVISLLGLFLVDQPFMDGMALASIFAVVAVLVATLTLLPAAFGFAGRAMTACRFRVSGGVRPPGRRTPPRDSGTMVAGTAPAGAVAVAAGALVLALRLLSYLMRLAFTDAGNDPGSSNPTGFRPARAALDQHGSTPVEAAAPRQASRCGREDARAEDCAHLRGRLGLADRSIGRPRRP